MDKYALVEKCHNGHHKKSVLRKVMAIAMTVFVVLAGALSGAGNVVYALALTGDELLEANRAIPVESNQVPNWPQGPIVGAESAILIDADTGVILYEKMFMRENFLHRRLRF